MEQADGGKQQTQLQQSETDVAQMQPLQSQPENQTTADLLAPENLPKIIQAKRLSLDVGAGLNYVRPRAKPYYCYRRFKKRMGQRKEEESTQLDEGPLSSDDSSDALSLEDESGELAERGTSEARIRRKTTMTPWTSEVHLYLWEKARVYIDSYRRNVTVAVHPAILDEENIRQLLYTDDAHREPTPLSLNIYLAISLGAHAEGEKQIWLEFWMKTRNELEGLFDDTDYNVAVALVLMGCHTFFANNEREKALYYVIISQAICRKMGYLNSDCYLRGLSLLTFQARKKPLTTKALRRFQEKMVEMNAQPYYYIPLKLPKPTAEQLAPTGGPTKNLDQDFIFQSLHNLLAKILFNIATGFALIKLRLHQRHQREVELRHHLNQYFQHDGSIDPLQENSPGSQQTRDAFINERFTEELVQKLAALHAEVEERGRDLKTAYFFWVQGFSASLIVDVFWNLGETMRALDTAMVYLGITQLPSFQYTISSIPVLCLPALNIFLATRNFSKLEELIRALNPLKTRFQPLETLLAPFEERLEAQPHEDYLLELLNMPASDALLPFSPSPLSHQGQGIMNGAMYGTNSSVVESLRTGIHPMPYH